MRKEDLFEAIGDIKTEYLVESEQVKHRPYRRYVMATASVAAMLMISIGGIQVYKNSQIGNKLNQQVEEHQGETNLAKIEQFQLHSESGLYEVCTFDDITNELKYVDNLLQSPVKSKYPVYEGFGAYEELVVNQAIVHISDEQYETLSNQLARRAGTTIIQTDINYYELNPETKEEKTQVSSKVYTCENGMIIEVYATGSIELQMKEAIQAPTISDETDLYKRSITYFQYYFEQYKALFGFDKPHYSLGAMDPESNIPEEIVTMDFRDAQVEEDADDYYEIEVIPGNDTIGDIITFTYVDYGKSIGEYPIISLEEAKEELIQGKGITLDTLFDQITESRIADVTLTYMGENPQPIYTFYLKLTEDEKQEAYSDSIEIPEGDAYIKYYVSAVNEKYIK